jgi:hypothetical protein
MNDSELAPWEQEKTAFLSEIDQERQATWLAIQHLLLSSERRQVVLDAFALRESFLQKYPNDVSLIQQGATLLRYWEQRGGSEEELAHHLGWTAIPLRREKAA